MYWFVFALVISIAFFTYLSILSCIILEKEYVDQEILTLDRNKTCVCWTYLSSSLNHTDGL